MKNAYEDILLCLESVPEDDALLGELIGLVDKATLDADYVLSGRGLPAMPPAPAPKKSPLRSIWQSSVTGALFYIMLAVVVVGAMLYMDAEGSAGVPRDFAGFAVMTVLTRSMQSEIPQGSFIVIRNTEPNTLQVGDDITFLQNENTTFTHRIITIHESYLDTGKRGFQTKGVDNAAPDAEIVIADNVIGKVIFHSLPIGQFFGFIQSNLLLSAIIGVLVLGLFLALRMIFSPRREQQKPQKPKRKRKK